MVPYVMIKKEVAKNLKTVNFPFNIVSVNRQYNLFLTVLHISSVSACFNTLLKRSAVQTPIFNGYNLT